MDAPAFLYTDKDRKNSENFLSVTKNDIRATIKFLYKRGMWSKYHYIQWMAELEDCKDEEILHLWWDAIVGGAMFEVEPRLDARLDAMEEFEEDKVEKHKMKCRRNKLMKKETGAK